MKNFLAILLFGIILTGCQTQPAFTDNGNPGQIKAVIFYDENRNGVMDGSETGAQTELGLSQDVSCPPSRKDAITPMLAGADGVALFSNLKPGEYCIHPVQNFGMTTRQNQKVYVSSEQTTTVFFGIEK